MDFLMGNGGTATPTLTLYPQPRLGHSCCPITTAATDTPPSSLSPFSDSPGALMLVHSTKHIKGHHCY